jgi:hypothetical protein
MVVVNLLNMCKYKFASFAFVYYLIFMSLYPEFRSRNASERSELRHT